MQDLLRILTPADYTFLIGVIEGPVGFADGQKLRKLLASVESFDTEESRGALNRQLERDIRYLGSADFAYLARFMTGQEPGVPFREIVRDVANVLKVEASLLGSDREIVESVVESYATKQFASFTPAQQQELLEQLGVERDRAAAFLKKSAGVFAIPTLIQAFGTLVVNGLIKTVIFGTIAKIIGKQLAGKLFAMLMARFPWWVSWIGPVSWSISIGWAVIDIQGPAYRKTVPVVLYLGLCSLRERKEEAPESP